MDRCLQPLGRWLFYIVVLVALIGGLALSSCEWFSRVREIASSQSRRSRRYVWTARQLCSTPA